MSDPNYYEVGFRKPPKETRFKPGQRANPNGRPKGSRNLKTDLLEELQELVTVQTGGRPIRISKQRALVKKLVAQALNGDARATGQLIALAVKLLADLPPDAPATLDPQDADILRRYLNREMTKQASSGNTPREDEDAGNSR